LKQVILAILFDAYFPPQFDAVWNPLWLDVTVISWPPAQMSAKPAPTRKLMQAEPPDNIARWFGI